MHGMQQQHQPQQQYPPGLATGTQPRRLARRATDPIRPRVAVRSTSAVVTTSTSAAARATAAELMLLVVVMLGGPIEAQHVHVAMYGDAVVLLGAVAEARVQLRGLLLTAQDVDRVATAAEQHGIFVVGQFFISTFWGLYIYII